MKKKILLVVRWPVGGIKTYFRYIYGSGKFSDFDLTIVAPDLEFREYLSANLDDVGYDFIECENSDFSLFKTAFAVLKTQRFDLVHSHGFTAAILLAPLAFVRRATHLATVHDVFRPAQFQGWKGQSKRFSMGLVCSLIDRFHTVSSDARDNLREYFPSIKPNKIEKILHGVDTEFFYNSTPAKYSLGESADNPYLIGFFGRFMSQKGFRTLVDAMGILIAKKPFLNVRVQTFGWGGFIREDYEYLTSKGLSKYFVQMPYEDNMASAIKGHDLVVMPSLWEACGLLGMEVLTSGVPFIGTSCLGLREIIEGTPAAMVPSQDSVSLANAIESEINSDRTNEFREYAIIAKERFCVGKSARALRDLYISLL